MLAASEFVPDNLKVSACTSTHPESPDIQFVFQGGWKGTDKTAQSEGKLSRRAAKTIILN